MSSAAAPSAGQTASRRWRPRVTHTRKEADPGAAEQAAAELLAALGLDLTDGNLAETPRRMARAPERYPAAAQ